MANDEQGREVRRGKQAQEPIATSGPAAAEQGRYGSGGSYGVGGGFDDADGRDSAPGRPDGRADRAARSLAQQDGEQAGGFEREVDPEAAPPSVKRDNPRTKEQQQLAEKNRRGSRI